MLLHSTLHCTSRHSVYKRYYHLYIQPPFCAAALGLRSLYSSNENVLLYSGLSSRLVHRVLLNHDLPGKKRSYDLIFLWICYMPCNSCFLHMYLIQHSKFARWELWHCLHLVNQAPPLRIRFQLPEREPLFHRS